jgi:hypothetical protein
MFASNCSTSSAVLCGLKGFQPATAKSNSASVSAGMISVGNCATCPANCPSVIDFSCGFHPNDSSGTRSKSLRVVFASC